MGFLTIYCPESRTCFPGGTEEGLGREHKNSWGGYAALRASFAATGLNPGNQSRKESLKLSFRTAVRTARNGCTVQRFHLICWRLAMPLLAAPITEKLPFGQRHKKIAIIEPSPSALLILSLTFLTEYDEPAYVGGEAHQRPVHPAQRGQ